MTSQAHPCTNAIYDGEGLYSLGGSSHLEKRKSSSVEGRRCWVNLSFITPFTVKGFCSSP